jgi:hypothetical protein
VTQGCGNKESHLGHTWGDTTYAEDMGVMWNECPGVEYPRFSWPPSLPPITETNGEALVEQALRERRGDIATERTTP